MPRCHCLFSAILVFSCFLTAGCCFGPCSPALAGSPDPIVPDERVSEAFVLSGVPDLLQNAAYTCGATAVRSVLSYWGKEIPEETLIVLLNTTGEAGTPPQNIVNGTQSLGFAAQVRTDLTLTDLEALVRAGVPVIVGMEDQRNRSTVLFEEQGTNAGHYMVVIGFDTTSVWLEDPAVLGNRIVLPRDAFLARWQIAGKDVRSPDAMTVTRMAIVIRGDRTGTSLSG